LELQNDSPKWLIYNPFILDFLVFKKYFIKVVRLIKNIVRG